MNRSGAKERTCAEASARWSELEPLAVELRTRAYTILTLLRALVDGDFVAFRDTNLPFTEQLALAIDLARRDDLDAGMMTDPRIAEVYVDGATVRALEAVW